MKISITFQFNSIEEAQSFIDLYKRIEAIRPTTTVEEIPPFYGTKPDPWRASRICKNPKCLINFVPERDDQEYHSPKCRQQDYMRRYWETHFKDPKSGRIVQKGHGVIPSVKVKKKEKRIENSENYLKDLKKKTRSSK